MQSAPAQHSQGWEVTDPQIMELSGYLDSDAALRVEEDVLLCIGSGARKMVLDCAGLSYATGGGMQCFLRLARNMQAVGGKLVVCNMDPQVRKIFDACELESIIPVYNGQNAAKLALAA